MRTLTPFVLLIAALFAVIQLDRAPSNADLVFVNRSDIFTLDPQRMSYLADFRMAAALYENLLRWDNHTFEIEPAAADLPTVSADQRTYTFHIRDAARWSNGQRVTAHDFVYSWKRLILPETAADYSNLFFIIDGAEAFWRFRQQQLRAFVADPWQAEPDEAASATHRFVRRVKTLLNTDDLPEAVNMPAADQRQTIAGALRDLRTLAESSQGDVSRALNDAERLRDLYHALNESASREAEARWMWRQAQKQFHQTVGIQALDAQTLRVRLKRPVAYFEDLVCFAVCAPVYRPCVEGWIIDDTKAKRIMTEGWHATPPPKFEKRRWVSINARSGRFEQQHLWARPERLVTNGPYELVEWRYKRDMRLRRNPHYHNQAMIKSDTVLMRVIEDANTRVLAFETGDVDWLPTVGVEYQSDMLAERRAYVQRYSAEMTALQDKGHSLENALARLPAPQAGERRNIHAIPAFGTDFFSFNCRAQLADGRDNPFAEARVRRAFAQAVNKKVIVEQVTRLDEPVMNTLIPRGSIAGYESPAGLSHDIKAAQRELRSADWIDRDGDGVVEDEQGNAFPTIDLLYTTSSPRYKWMSLELKSQWEKALDVRVELRGVDTKFYKEDLKEGQFMIARGRWYGDYGDPTTFLNLFHSTNGNNDRGYANPNVDAMLDQAAHETDPEARMDLLEECERVLFQQELPMVPICQLVEVYMYEPGALKGLSTHPRLVQYLWQMETAQ